MGKIWYAMNTFNELNCCNELLLFSIYCGMTVWSTGVLQDSGIDCFTQPHVPHSEDLAILLTTSHVVCGAGSGETRWGTNQVIKLADICPNESGTRNEI